MNMKFWERRRNAGEVNEEGVKKLIEGKTEEERKRELEMKKYADQLSRAKLDLNMARSKRDVRLAREEIRRVNRSHKRFSLPHFLTQEEKAAEKRKKAKEAEKRATFRYLNGFERPQKRPFVRSEVGRRAREAFSGAASRLGEMDRAIRERNAGVNGR